MKKYSVLAFLLFVTVLLSIVVFHSSMNLVERTTPPSEMWGRDMTVGETDFRKIPTEYVEGNYLNLIYASADSFQKVLVDSKGVIANSETIRIKGYEPTKLVKYQSLNNLLFWTENYDLYYSDLESRERTKVKLLSEVQDFELTGNNNELLISVAEKDKLAVYGFSGGVISKLSEDTPVSNIYYIDAAKDNSGSLFIAGVSRLSPTDYELRLFSFETGTGKLTERISPAIIENMYTTREGSNSINNLQVAFDNKDIYVFYEIGKNSSQGMVARTYIGRLPKNQQGIARVNFDRLMLNNESADKEVYISSLSCADGKSGKLHAVIITPLKASVKREGSELMFITIEEGKVVYQSIVSNTGAWNRFAILEKIDGDYMATFLQTLGGIQFRINVAGTGAEFKKNLNKITFDDIKYSVMDTVGSYVFSFFSIFINLLVSAPLLFWPIAVDFFEWRTFLRKPLLTLHIGVVIEASAMYFSIMRVYANSESVSFMPPILQHPFSPLAVLLITTLFSYIIVRLFRKDRVDMSYFPELALFMLVHNVFVYFLYTAYIARF
ncbi:MAG: hypothetical protein ACM3TR_07170 [Caulobacteraceae bacterium]